MCSIAGCIRSGQEAEVQWQLEQMTRILHHRGPDGNGIFISTAGEKMIGLAHNRLRILDLSSASAQPFHLNEKIVMVYNGELYNYKEVREQLTQKGYTFHTTGDTEVVLTAYHAYGKDCLEHFDGMFALAIWDKEAGKLFCARDRFGEKPFYFQQDDNNGSFCFASELAALLDTGTDASIDETMLYQYLTHGFTKMPNQPWKTFYKKIFQLPPAHTLTYDLASDSWEIQSYWDLDNVSCADQHHAVDHFSALLKKSVKQRLRADVAIGTSLSGGIDSSSIAAFMATEQPNYKTFSAIFPGFEKDESKNIFELTKYLGSELFTISPNDQDFAERIQEVILHHREPIGSASVFAQYLVYEKAAQEGIKIILDGQGADESLAGYRKYTHWYLQELIKTVGWKEATRQAQAFKQNTFLDHWGWKNFLAAYLPSVTAWQLEKKVISEQKSCTWIHPDFAATAHNRLAIHKPIVEKLNDIQYHDLRIMGLEELLRYADRNSMAHGVEVRLPFLSHELVQYVLRLPADYRMRNGYTKWMLRACMHPFIPNDIIWQKGKIGFEVPQQQWMENAQIKEQIFECKKRLNALGITRQTKKELNTTERFRILVVGSLLATT